MAKLSGIILHRLKYSETSLIVKILTREHGIISGMARGVRKSKKGGFLFQPGNIVDVECTKKATNDLYSIKECVIKHPYQNILDDISKNMVIVFLSEFLLRAIEEEHQDLELYDFILEQFLLLDIEKNQKVIKEFHLHFLIELTKYLGFYPENNYQKGMSFNLLTGRFSKEAVHYDLESSSWFAQLLSANINDIVLDTKIQRKEVLSLLVKYYKTHLQGLGEVKSLKVLEALAD
ncbi:MAG: DNA repair protein RecO [Flavobacteriales bacterium]|nr:DNA repair protein RecO [Flavobacteriales bacterium]